MRSGHVVDSESRTRQIDQFFQQRSRETLKRAEDSARQATRDVLSETHKPLGKMLEYADFTRRLSLLNPSLLFERTKAFPDQAGIYVREDGANSDDLELRNRNRRFVTGMAWGTIPEFTQMIRNEDEHGEAKPRVVKKGWRDTLKVLIQARLVTLTAVEKAFGSGGKNWHLQLH